MIDLYEELRQVAAQGNDFATSLVRQHDSGRTLSHAQLAAAERMLGRDAATQAAAGTDLMRCHDMFREALDNGMKAPRFRFMLEGSEVALSLAKATSPNAGALYVKLDGEYAGKVQGGRYFPRDVHPDDAPVIAARLLDVARDPAAAAYAYGHETNRCACCGKLLTDDKRVDLDGMTAVQRGVGGTCARNWGLI